MGSADYSPKPDDLDGYARHRRDDRGVLADGRMQPQRKRGMSATQRSDQRWQIVAHVRAGAEKERHDLDRRRTCGLDLLDRLGERRRHQLEEGERDRQPGSGGAHLRRDRLERLRPARIASAVSEQDQCAWSRPHR